MDIQDLGGSKLEQTFTSVELAQVCPGCASEVNSADRFCQECGTRIGTNRSKKATNKDKSDRPAIEPSSALIICINCGTTNKALSIVCSDCKIPLIPAQRRREDKLTGEKTGLRGSLTSRTNRPVFRTMKPSGPASENTKPASESRVSSPINHSGPQTETQTATPITQTINELQASPSEQTNDSSAPKKTRAKQRLPGFISPIFKRQNLSGDTSEDGLDFLFADYSKADQVQANPFDKLSAETRTIGGSFSLSTMQYTIESFFERIPIPVLFILLSFIIICATANATTQWNRYEQRMKAIDKIAANSEEDMRSFQLDKVIHTMKELEKTEKGDLPPRARAVLDQSLWLRSYSFAKQREYAKAVADLSLVSANFTSYEDAVEKLDEYKTLLASHPEFASPASLAASEKSQSVKPKKEESKKPASDGLLNEVDQLKKQPREKHKSTDTGFAAQETLAEPPANKKATSSSPVTPPAASAVKTSKKDNDKPSPKSQAALLDHDMKRYSNLLVEYFSKAESNQSDHLAEPPSYEEWTTAGKHDF